MKPTNKQKEVAKIIKDQASFWGSTNDINSPTHHCDIDECVGNAVFFEIITKQEANELEIKLRDLFVFVKKLQ